ncbi:MAG: hypothetical protein JW700_00745 [Candidatus Aenigmarchaeota archaeon]|nr:hypothetical protein [Candidatus Aenigmarchaeota archaeon]
MIFEDLKDLVEMQKKGDKSTIYWTLVKSLQQENVLTNNGKGYLARGQGIKIGDEELSFSKETYGIMFHKTKWPGKRVYVSEAKENINENQKVPLLSCIG